MEHAHKHMCAHACMHACTNFHTHHHHLVSQLNNVILSPYFTGGIISINEIDSTGLLKLYRAGVCLESDCCTSVTVLCKHPLLVNLSPLHNFNPTDLSEIMQVLFQPLSPSYVSHLHVILQEYHQLQTFPPTQTVWNEMAVQGSALKRDWKCMLWSSLSQLHTSLPQLVACLLRPCPAAS